MTGHQIWKENRLRQLRATMPRDSADVQWAKEILASENFIQPQDIDEACMGLRLRGSGRKSDVEELKSYSRRTVPVVLPMSDLPDQARAVLVHLSGLIEGLK